MADIFYSMDRGETEFDIVEQATTPGKDIEIAIDDAVSWNKEEVLRAIDMLKNHIIKQDNY